MATTTLLCKQCNFENEPERVYCHNCGAKLDRSLLPIDAVKRDDPNQVQDRVRKVFSPRRGNVQRSLKSFGLALLSSVLLAAFIQTVRPPRAMPSLSQDTVMGAPAIRDDMENIVAQSGARRLAYTEEQVNGFLQYSIRSKTESFIGIPLKFERVFVHLEEGTCRITKQQSVFGFPVYATETYGVALQGGKLSARNLGGALGRLSLPGFMMSLLNRPLFGSFWDVFSVEQRLLGRMQSLAVHKGGVEIISKPGG